MMFNKRMFIFIATIQICLSFVWSLDSEVLELLREQFAKGSKSNPLIKMKRTARRSRATTTTTKATETTKMTKKIDSLFMGKTTTRVPTKPVLTTKKDDEQDKRREFMRRINENLQRFETERKLGARGFRPNEKRLNPNDPDVQKKLTTLGMGNKIANFKSKFRPARKKMEVRTERTIKFLSY